MNPADSSVDLNRLLMELVDGELTPVQKLHLMALLRNDPAAREQYVDYLWIDSLLAWELSLVETDPRGESKVHGEPIARHEGIEAQASVREPGGRATWSRTWRRRTGRAAALAALILMLLVGLGRWQSPDPRPVAIDATGANLGNGPPREPRAGGFAILTRVVDVVWEDADSAPVVGSLLSEGVLHFRSGVVQLEFYSGATVVLEGPAAIELKATNWIACRYGKLRALVPPRAHGFRVDSSSVDLVDLGTEFGMRVAPDRKAEVHVFDGKVELYKANPRTGQEERWELAEGNGLRIGITGDITPLAADSPAFLTPPDLDRLYRKESGRRYNEWATRSPTWVNDRRLVTYFSFEGDRKPGSRVLLNQGGDRSSDGAIVGCEWVDGRWPGKGALEFKRPSDRVRIDVRGEFASLTLTAWVRIDAIEHRFNSLMLTDGFEPGETHWQIDHLGRLILGVRGKSAECEVNWFKDYASPRVLTPERFGRWMQLATVYDHHVRTVTHYVDGVAVGSEALAFDIILRVGEAEIGNWGVPRVDDETPVRNLCGRMDEFALFRVALDPKEVRVLYERGLPDGGRRYIEAR